MLSYFVGTTLWFAVAPLQTAIAQDLQLTSDDLFSASIASIASNFFVRIVAGTLSDWYGSRLLSTTLLSVGALGCGFTAWFVEGSTGLNIARFVTGTAGATLVVSQFWMSQMFSKRIIGTATGIALGVGIPGEDSCCCS